MISLDFDWQTNEFMLYCRTTQLREKSMMAYEQSLKLFQRWCMDEMGIFTVDKVTENVIRRYIMELQERGKFPCSSFHAFLYAIADLVGCNDCTCSSTTGSNVFPVDFLDIFLEWFSWFWSGSDSSGRTSFTAEYECNKQKQEKSLHFRYTSLQA